MAISNEGRDGIVSAMLGDMIGAQAPGLSNTAQGAQVADLGNAPPTTGPTSYHDYGEIPSSQLGGLNQGFSVTGLGGISGPPSGRGTDLYGIANTYGVPGFAPDFQGTFEAVTPPSQQQDQPPPIGDPMSPTFGQLGTPEALGAFASATQQGAPPVGQVEGPPVGQSGKGGVNAPVGITDYAARGDPFGELGLFGPDFYGGQQTDPVGTPQGVQGPYGEFGGFGPDAYGAYASAQGPEGYGFGSAADQSAWGSAYSDAVGQGMSDAEAAAAADAIGGFDGFDGYDGYGDDVGDDDDDDDGDDE